MQSRKVALEVVGFEGDSHDTDRRSRERQLRTLASSASREVKLGSRVVVENASEHGGVAKQVGWPFRGVFT